MIEKRSYIIMQVRHYKRNLEFCYTTINNFGSLHTARDIKRTAEAAQIGWLWRDM